MTAPTRVTIFAGAATMLVAMTLTPIFATAVWFWRGIGAAIVIGLVGAGLRRISSPRPLVVLGQLLAVFVYLTWLFSDNAILGLLPGPGAVADLGATLRSGLTDMDTYGPKVPETDGILLLTVGGVALVNVLVDAAAATYRRASVAGLPLLMLYTVPASVLDGGVAWPLFLTGALGFVGLLIAEGQERLVRWGRPLVAGLSADRASRPGGASRVDTTPFGQLGRRIGATAIGLAIVVPAVLPLRDGILFGGSGGIGAGGGAGRQQIRIDPWVSLRQNFFDPEDFEVVRLRSTGNPADLYLRMATLDTFDGVEWSASQHILDEFDNELPRLLGVSNDVARREIVSSAEIGDRLESYFLPVPYPVTEIDVDGSWRVERNTRNIISAKGPSQISGKSYLARSVVLEPTPQQLADAPGPPVDLQRYLNLPDQLPDNVEQQAREVTADADSSYDAALKLQAWLRGPEFNYDTSPGREGSGLSAIELFLTDKRGYCEQFAATMAVMARMVGIPARVNVGFSAGRRDVDGTTIVYSSHDAHAWPELYFDGVGWVRFEPTPFSSDRGGPPVFASARSEAEATSAPTPTQTSPPTDTPTGGGGPTASASGLCPLPRIELCDPDNATPLVPPAPNRVPQLLLAGAGALLILGAIPGLLRVGIRRRRWRLAGTDPGGRADTAWVELLDTARDLGYGRLDALTPRQTAQWLVKEAKLRARHQEPLLRLTKSVERARYALTPADDAHVVDDLAAVRTALATKQSRLRQVQAVLLPRSTWDVAHAVAERIADLLDAIDRMANWVSRRVLRIGRGEAAG